MERSSEKRRRSTAKYTEGLSRGSAEGSFEKCGHGWPLLIRPKARNSLLSGCSRTTAIGDDRTGDRQCGHGWLLLIQPIAGNLGLPHSFQTMAIMEDCTTKWRSLRDSNSCSRLERAVSWATRRRERCAAKRASIAELLRAATPGRRASKPAAQARRSSSCRGYLLMLGIVNMASTGRLRPARIPTA